jgi:hypothetical protein
VAVVTALLTRGQYADEVGASVKSVERWLKAGLLPEAVRQGGRWFIPSGTPRPDPDAATSRDVAPVLGPTSTLGTGGTLEEAAAVLGFSPTGLRRLYADMQATPGLPLYVGRYGPHGALRVYAAPRG